MSVTRKDFSTSVVHSLLFNYFQIDEVERSVLNTVINDFYSERQMCHSAVIDEELKFGKF